jgi:hypothetical protein
MIVDPGIRMLVPDALQPARDAYSDNKASL